MGNQITTKQPSLVAAKETLSQFINTKVANIMTDSRVRERFITGIVSAVTTNPALAECTRESIVSAALLGESLKLSPSPQLGQYYMVPFKNKKEGTITATFVLGYKGYIQLAIRSGYYKNLNVIAIKDGEFVKYDPLTEELQVNLIQDEFAREQAKTVGYYAMFEYTNGFRKAMYWSHDKMLAHADRYSAAFKSEDYQKLKDGKIADGELWKYSSFWYKDFDGMAFKTMLRQLISKWGIMSIEMQGALESESINEYGAGQTGEFIQAEFTQQAVTTIPEQTKSSAQDGFFAE